MPVVAARARGVPLSLAGTGISLLWPQFIRWIIDRGIRTGDVRFLVWSVVRPVGHHPGQGRAHLLDGPLVRRSSPKVRPMTCAPPSTPS
ncbi:MAG: hypothetical protein R2851_18960 [Caldilineaceae bacterium]